MYFGSISRTLLKPIWNFPTGFANGGLLGHNRIASPFNRAGGETIYRNVSSVRRDGMDEATGCTGPKSETEVLCHRACGRIRSCVGVGSQRSGPRLWAGRGPSGRHPGEELLVETPTGRKRGAPGTAGSLESGSVSFRPVPNPTNATQRERTEGVLNRHSSAGRTAGKSRVSRVARRGSEASFRENIRSQSGQSTARSGSFHRTPYSSPIV